MVTEIYATGKTVNEAFEALKAKLGVGDLDSIEWKVVSAGKKGKLFGIGGSKARTRTCGKARAPRRPRAAPRARTAHRQTRA